ncbi:MAG: hypothetical protein KY453_03965 [Gemmatimonadetes bacterium]|nr:hypothetical protein [Gemmatimonadota bacterium]
MLVPALTAAFALAPPLDAQDVPPDGWVEAEAARTRMCVPALARLIAVSDELEPLARRAERIRALAGAVSLEDTTAVAPFDASDPVERDVRDWFAADAELAQEYVATGDESIQRRRAEGREAIRRRLGEAFQALTDEGQARMSADGDLQAAAATCEDAILVRSVALEVCDTTESPVCDAARSPESSVRFRFVDAPEDLWDVESIRPWSEPSRLGRAPGGGLAGAGTGTVVSRGNLVAVVGLEAVIQPRASLAAEAAEAMDASLDSMGFAFEHPGFVMAPALALRLDVPARLGGATHYLLHFGDLSDPDDQVVWSGPVAEGEPVQALAPLSGRTLERLAAGEALSLTAARLPEGGEGEGDAIFTLGLPTAGQARAVSGWLTYMAGGQLARDLAALVPPSGSSGS